MRRKLFCALMSMMLMLSMAACDAVGADILSRPAEKNNDDSEEGSEERSGEETSQHKNSMAVDKTESDRLMEVTQVKVGSQSYMEINNKYAGMDASRVYYTLSPDSAEQYPELAKVLKQMQRDTEKSLDDAMSFLKEGLEEIITYREDAVSLEDCSDGVVLRADNVVFSYLATNQNYYGGAHGGYWIGGAAFDVETGEQLSLSDVVADAERMKKLTAKTLYETYGEIFFYDVFETIAGYDMSEFTWSMDYFGVYLYFNQYELASYADGVQTVYFSFAEYPDLFVEKYTALPEQYVVPLQESADYSVDVNGDGKEENFQVKSTYEEYDYYSSSILYNGSEIEDAAYVYDVDYYLVKTGAGGFIYCFHLLENDYTTLTVFDLSRGEFTLDGESRNFYLPGRYEYKEDEAGYHYQVITQVWNDPTSFELKSKMDVLSTYDGMKTYRVGENGWPVSDDPYFSADTNYLLHTLQNVPSKLVNPDGTVIEKNCVVPKGCYLKIVGATEDGVYVMEATNYVRQETEFPFFEADENTQYRSDVLYYIRLDEPYGWKIGGIEIDQLFEGMFFAG